MHFQKENKQQFSNEHGQSLSGSTIEREVKHSWMSNGYHWSSYVVAVFSFIYGAIGIYWFQGGAGFPFGENDPRGEMMGSFLANVQTDTGGIAIALIGFSGCIVALASNRRWSNQFLRIILLAFAWTLSVVLLVVIPDARLLQNFAYLFLLKFHLIDWPVINQLFCMVIGLLWGATALSFWRRMRKACMHCGRLNDPLTMTYSPIKWGKYATYLAVLFALPYGIVRLAWAAGVPLGRSASLIANQTLSDRISELVIGGLPIMGAILTFGLIQRWGEIFPRWCFFLAGKRIPIWFVVVPATLAAALTTLAGLKVSPPIISGILNHTVTSQNWGELGPALFWLPWGISLGFAIFAYYLRRRGPCNFCERS